MISSGALAFLAIRKLKNSTAFLLAALGCALPCYGILLIVTSTIKSTTHNISRIIVLWSVYIPYSIPLFIVGALGLLDFCKNTLILSRFRSIHKILHYLMIAFAVWHLGIGYAPIKAVDDLGIIIDGKYTKDILVVDFWIAAAFIGFTCFLLARTTRLMTKVALGVHFSIFFVYAIIWSIYATDKIDKKDDILEPTRVTTRYSVILGALLPASLAAIIFLYIRENPDDSETLL